ncbi:MAG TPA: HD domain-containing protein [Gemmatimonadales bacterium]|nr:HD domain-containing protein [Gemmatimonadales bacterium]
MAMPTDLKHAGLGERVQDPLLVFDVEQKTFGDKECTVLVLGNASGRLASAPFWGAEQTMVAGIAKGDVVQVIGEIGQFRDKRQLKVGSIRPLPKGSVDLRQLMPAIASPAPFWERLDRWRAEIRQPRLRHVLDLFFDDDDFRARFEECPGSTVGHHAELGGLLRHVWEVAAIGRQIAKVGRADADLVVAGALLHDIGKLESYRWDGAFETTECGALLGHVALGVMMLERRLAQESVRPCTDQELMLLEHLILSHHGKLEYGAAVPPMTLEAEILHYADNASAKTASMHDALSDPENFPGDADLSARGIWQLDRRRAYRGASDWGLAELEAATPAAEGPRLVV